MKAEYKEKALTSEIINAAYEVQNTLGSGFLEKVYKNALCMELVFRNIKVEREKDISVNEQVHILRSF